MSVVCDFLEFSSDFKKLGPTYSRHVDRYSPMTAIVQEFGIINILYCSICFAISLRCSL